MSPFWSSPFPLDPQQGQLRTSAEFPHFFLPKSFFPGASNPSADKLWLLRSCSTQDATQFSAQFNSLKVYKDHFHSYIFKKCIFFFPSIFLFEKGSTLKYRTTKNIKQLSGGCLNGKKKSVDTRFYFFFISAF